MLAREALNAARLQRDLLEGEKEAVRGALARVRRGAAWCHLVPPSPALVPGPPDPALPRTSPHPHEPCVHPQSYQSHPQPPDCWPPRISVPSQTPLHF